MRNIEFTKLGQLALWLAVIGAINWGLTALGFNLVDLITGDALWLENTIYIIVGLAGLAVAFYALTKGHRSTTADPRLGHAH